MLISTRGSNHQLITYLAENSIAQGRITRTLIKIKTKVMTLLRKQRKQHKTKYKMEKKTRTRMKSNRLSNSRCLLYSSGCKNRCIIQIHLRL